MRALSLAPDEVEWLVEQGVPIERDRDGRKRYEGEIAGATVRVVVAVDRPDLVVTVYRRSK